MAGASISATDTSNSVKVTYINTTPTKSAGGSGTVTSSNGDAVTIDGVLAFTDPDFNTSSSTAVGNWGSGSLDVAVTNGDTNHDTLTIAQTGGITSSGSTAGSTVSYNNVQIGTIANAATGAPGQHLTITLLTEATNSAVSALAEAIQFTSSGTSTTTARTVTFTAKDGAAATVNASDTVNVGIGPALTAVSIASSNATPTLATVGDVITVSFTTDGTEAATPTATIDGNAATVTLVSGSSYTATYTMASGDTEGAVTFSISALDAGGHGVPVTADVGNTSSVTFDQTPPSAPTNVTVTAVGGTVVSNALNATNTDMTAQATITAGQATGGTAQLYLGSTLIATDSTIASGDTTVSFDLGKTTKAALEAAITNGGTVSVKLYDPAGNSVTSTDGNPTLLVDYSPPTALVTGRTINNSTNITNARSTEEGSIVIAHLP